MSWYSDNDWKPYVSVAQRKAQALREMEILKQNGTKIQPIKIQGRTISNTFWGEAWCDHLESISDFSNRLPRGRSYVRNGSVCHLEITRGEVQAYVSGSDLYKLKINIDPLSEQKWATIKQQCTGQIGSLLELLEGKLSESIMAVVTDPTEGMFPNPEEISLNCDCPDYAYLCKHLAAVMYGIGARLDQEPDLLFLLRGVDHEELISLDTEQAVGTAVNNRNGKHLADDDLSDIFGIEIEATDVDDSTTKIKTRSRKKTVQNKSKNEKAVRKKTVKKKAVKKKGVKKKGVKKSPATKKTTKRSATVKKTPPRRKTAKKK